MPENDCLSSFTSNRAGIHSALMTPTLTALNTFLVLLTWQGQTDTTYTVQTSLDLRSWSTLPAVFRGGLDDLSVAFEVGVAPLFTRLRASEDGDTNENGLPDHWEWSQFGIVDVDPLADPDEDGSTNYTEWLAGSDPLDFYNGESVLIRLACGDDWRVPANEVSGQTLALSLNKSNGEPWPDAPVTLRLESGTAGLLQSGENPGTAAQEVIAYTDAMGRITAAHHDIHVLGAPEADVRDRLHISAGQASAGIRIRTLAGALPSPPREVRQSTLADGTHQVSWRGDPSGALAFLIESLSDNGQWVSVANLPASELPLPDPATNRFALAIESF